MVVIEPVKDSDLEDDTWRGTINEIASITKKQITELRNNLNKRTERLHAVLTKNLAKNLDEKLKFTHVAISEVKEDFNRSEQRVEQKISMVQGEITSIKTSINDLNVNMARMTELLQTRLEDKKPETNLQE